MLDRGQEQLQNKVTVHSVLLCGRLCRVEGRVWTEAVHPTLQFWVRAVVAIMVWLAGAGHFLAYPFVCDSVKQPGTPHSCRVGALPVSTLLASPLHPACTHSCIHPATLQSLPASPGDFCSGHQGVLLILSVSFFLMPLWWFPSLPLC